MQCILEPFSKNIVLHFLAGLNFAFVPYLPYKSCSLGNINIKWVGILFAIYHKDDNSDYLFLQDQCHLFLFKNLKVE